MLNREVERWRIERDRINESVKMMRIEAQRHREERDRANQRVAELKKRIEALRHDLTEERRRLSDIEAYLERSRLRLPPKQDVEERLRRIEWEIMTTPTGDMMDREKVLAEEGQRLRSVLARHEKLDTQEDEKTMVLADIKAMELEIRRCRDEISRLHEASEENHGRMILLHRRADEERRRADEAHAKFLERLSAVKVIDEKLREIAEEARGLRSRLREAERREEAAREQLIKAKRRELVREARRKLEAGERLSLEEMKLLYEDEGEDER